MTQSINNGADAPKTIIVVGAGQRGQVSTARARLHGGAKSQIYASYALQHPDLVRIIGVADLSKFRRKVIARDHGCVQSHLPAYLIDVSESLRA